MAENGENAAKSQRYDELVSEIRRRYGIVYDQLIGQSPEDLPRHYTLTGMRDAFKGLLKFIEDGITSS